MGSCNISSLAKAVCGERDFSYTVIGAKPGEKLYEELVTDIEAKKLVYTDGYYVVCQTQLISYLNLQKCLQF